MSQSSSPPPQKIGPSTGFILLVCALSTFPSVTGDIYLPALPQLTADLTGTTIQGQHTLAAYFLGLGLGQLFYGPTVDRIGRKPMMIFGAVLYLAATAGCFFASSIDQMIVLRFVQALGACSGLVVSSTVARDRFADQELARVISLLLTARSLGPLLAPIIGGLLVTGVGWRGVFGALGVFGMSLLLAVALGMKETRPDAVARQARLESPLRAYREVVIDSRIRGYMATAGFNYAAMFAWISVAPYLVIQIYGISELWFGWIFGVLGFGITIASQINRRLLHYYAADWVLLWGALMAGAAAIVMAFDILMDVGGIFGVMVPLFLIVSSVGLVSTNAMAGALGVDPSRSGSVSAVVGTGQFSAGAIAAGVVGLVSENPATGMAVVILCCTTGAIIYPMLLARRRGRAVPS